MNLEVSQLIFFLNLSKGHGMQVHPKCVNVDVFMMSASDVSLVMSRERLLQLCARWTSSINTLSKGPEFSRSVYYRP